jgi:hypothetical protein
MSELKLRPPNNKIHLYKTRMGQPEETSGEKHGSEDPPLQELIGERREIPRAARDDKFFAFGWDETLGASRLGGLADMGHTGPST